MAELYDVVIIGGGINGCGCAADAALRGLSVLLCEKDDLAANTSSKSTKLIHGGLRYLEHYNFSMVKKALLEREHLLKLAPHLVKPLELVIPYKKHMRPAWMLRAGLFIYDNLSFKNSLPKSRKITRKLQPSYFMPLDPEISKGFVYYDGTTDDTRLTISNALQAKEHGAKIMTRTELISASVHNRIWHLRLKQADGSQLDVRAHALINAAGPWVETVSQLLDIPLYKKMTLVQGSHIVVPKLYEGTQAYFLQHQDKRMIFVIPYHGATMIGTTDVEFKGDLNHVEITPEEIEYLCTLTNDYFNRPIGPNDVLNAWSGVRPLIQPEEGDKLQSISRDYSFHFDTLPAPAVTIYGGKITTYRQLSAETVSALNKVFANLPKSQTLSTPLPGARLDALDFKTYQQQAKKRYAWVETPLLDRYLSVYGTLTEKILAGKTQMQDLGQRFSAWLYQAEVDYLVGEEWAMCAEDILWRRTKLGLHMTEQEIHHFSSFFNSSKMAETSASSAC